MSGCDTAFVFLISMIVGAAIVMVAIVITRR